MELLPLRISMGFVLQTYSLISKNENFSRAERKKEGKQNALDQNLLRDSLAKEVADSGASSSSSLLPASALIELPPFVCMDEDLWAPEQFASPAEEEEAWLQLEEEDEAGDEAGDEADEVDHRISLDPKQKSDGVAVPIRLNVLRASG